MRPDIDLARLPHAGIISRTHAHLYWDIAQKAYMIVDDSRNGSYLNDKLLPRGAPHLLNNGDKLQFGQDGLICLQVELIAS
jgi:pSer/pThr/pTyr-binding forkhead associated (FHA) protein